MPGLAVARARGMRRSSCWMLLLCASCGGIGDPDPNRCTDGDCVGGEETLWYAPYRPRPVFDLVLVVDDSIPSGPHAEKLERAVHELAENLRSPVTGQYEVDINIALVPATSDATALWPRSAYCPLPNGGFLHSAELCAAPNNFQGDLADALT